MATAEEPAPLPSFPEMILAAISALGDSNTDRAAIVKFIGNKYPNLPVGHEAAVADSLEKMKVGGQLTQSINGNYARRRGRGRPPKPKSADSRPSAPASSTKGRGRGRGRPPKARDPSDPLPVKKALPVRGTGSPRPRGRPPKAKPAVSVVGA